MDTHSHTITSPGRIKNKKMAGNGKMAGREGKGGGKFAVIKAVLRP